LGLDDSYWVAVLELYRSELLLTVGRLWEARSLAVAADQKFAKIGLVHKRAASLVVRGELALKLGHLAEAQSLADEIAALTDTGHTLIERFPCSLFRAKVPIESAIMNNLACSTCKPRLKSKRNARPSFITIFA
jgi:hypothetical protein